MQQLLELLMELQELCEQRHSLEVPGQWLALAEGAGLGVLLGSCCPPTHCPPTPPSSLNCWAGNFEPDSEGKGEPWKGLDR